MYRHLLFALLIAWSTLLPAQYLDFKSTTTNFLADFDGTNNSFFQLSENGVRRGYFGSFAGTAEDVDIGTSLDNALGDLHFTIQAAPRMTLKQSGNFGIGTTNPTEKLHVAGNIRLNNDGDLLGLDQLIGFNDLRFYGDPNDGPDIFIAANGNVGINTSNPTENLHLNGTMKLGDLLFFATPVSFRMWGNLEPQDTNPTFHNRDLGHTDHWWRDVYALNFLGPSDVRYKREIADLKYGLSEVLKIRPVSYRWKHDEGGDKKYGIIAQEMMNILPDIVQNSDLSDPSKGRYNISYIEIIPVLIKAIQEQQSLIKSQQKKIQTLKEKVIEIESLEKRLTLLEALSKG